jgi:hypothetical protein
LLLLSAAPAIALDLSLIYRPENAALPAIERWQYIGGWPSGYGLPELKAFLEEQAQLGNLHVARLSFAYAPAQGLDVYLSPSRAIRLHTIDWTDPTGAKARVARLSARRRTLFVSSPDGEALHGVVAVNYFDNARLIWTYVKPGSDSKLVVWEILPP